MHHGPSARDRRHARPWITFLALSLFASLLARSAPVPAAEPPSQNQPPAFDPTGLYRTQQLEGWTLRVHPKLLEAHPELGQKTLTLLRHQLYQVTRVIPAEPLAQLKKIPIWVEHFEPHHKCMCYHVDPGWLRDHGMNPEKAKGVEVANAENFLTWTINQPWMVLHELAHGYHHQFLAQGYDNADLEQAVQRVREKKHYDQVLRISGKRERHYALTNQMEYFAEATEAYFGTNDYFPFVRSELELHDPEGHALIRRLWSAP